MRGLAGAFFCYFIAMIVYFCVTWLALFHLAAILSSIFNPYHLANRLCFFGLAVFISLARIRSMFERNAQL